MGIFFSRQSHGRPSECESLWAIDGRSSCSESGTPFAVRNVFGVGIFVARHLKLEIMHQVANTL